MATHTRTHTHISFANPYLTCDYCGSWVTGWHDPDQCGCEDGRWKNLPCKHPSGNTSRCVSWSPVNGCNCLDRLGHVPHRSPTHDS